MDTLTAAPASRRTHRRPQASDKAAPSPLLLLLGGALALLLLIAGSRLLLAGIANYQAEAFLKEWEKKRAVPTEEAWQIAHDAAQRAIALYPVDNSAYQHNLGLIHQWQHLRQPFGEPGAEPSRRAALEALRNAVAARPTWPEHWTALAYAKLYLLEFDEEFHHALAQARQLGPWRVVVNRQLAEIGFIAWPHLNADERSATLEAARRVARFGPQEAKNLLQVAAHTGMTQTLCDSLDAELKQSRKICL